MHLLTGVIAFAWASVAIAQVPNKLGYQGRLLKADGTPEVGIASMSFAVYDVSTGGTAVGCDALQVALNEGFYSVLLGGLGGCTFGLLPINPALIDGRELYLEVVVNGIPMLPRQRTGTVPYAFWAGTAVNVRGGRVEAASVTVGGATGVAISSSGINLAGKTVVDTSGKAAVATGTGLTGDGTTAAPLAVAFGTQAGTVTEGNDPRLSDARVPNASTEPVACAAATLGYMYYNTTTHSFFGCSTRGWTAVTPPYGEAPSNPAQSCRDLNQRRTGLSDGAYWVDPNGGSAADAFSVYCDMTATGGGWTLCANFIDTAGNDLSGSMANFEFGGDWTGYIDAAIKTPTTLATAGSVNCSLYITATSATEVRLECTRSNVMSPASWTSGTLTLGGNTLADRTVGPYSLRRHGEYAWGGYNRASWVMTSTGYPNCGGNSCGTDGTRYAPVEIELAGGIYSPGCAAGCGCCPVDSTGGDEGVSCGGIDTRSVSGERYSIFVR